MIVSARLFRRITLMAFLCSPVALAADGSPAGDGAGGGRRPERSVTADTPDAAREIARGLQLILKHHPDGAGVNVGAREDGALWLRGDTPLAEALYDLILYPIGRETAAEAGEAAPAEETRPAARTRRESPQEELAVRVFGLSHADAGVVSDYVEMLKVGSRTPWATAHDERTNSIIVKGSPALIDQAAALIQQLDRPADPADQGPQVIKLMPLSHAEATQLANVVADVLDTGRRRAGDLRIVAESQTNTIVLAGPEEQLAPVIELVRSLDQGRKASPEAEPAEASADDGARSPRAPGRPRDAAGGPAPRAARERTEPAQPAPRKPRNQPRPETPPTPPAPEAPPAPPEPPAPAAAPGGAVGTPAR